jgi:methionine sulfoxide reductase heme-binding subunit
VAGSIWRGFVALLAVVVESRVFKPAVFLSCLTPGAFLGWRLWQVIGGADPSALGPDPTKLLEHETGRYALGILLATLTVTPLRRLTGQNRLQSVRRLLGVWSFVYAALHVAAYLTFDQLCYSLETCQFPAIWEDVTRRPFIFVGASAFVILAALALTSTAGWVRRLRRNWQRLHRLVYAAAVLAAVRFVLAIRKRQARLVPAVSR